MQLSIRRTLTLVDERRAVSGPSDDPPLRKAAIITVVTNPFAGRYVQDLSELVAASVEIGEGMAARAVEAMKSHGVQSYGKAGLVGLDGEQEHANALLTTAFANPIRDAIGGGKAWISSMTKVAAPGAPIDVPMNHKDDVYVRSHYDGMSLAVPDLPMPDEIALIVCLSNRGRLNARVGGLTHEDVLARGE